MLSTPKLPSLLVPSKGIVKSDASNFTFGKVRVFSKVSSG